MKLTDILLEQVDNATLGDLRFGVNVQQRDSLPLPNSDSLRRINNEKDLSSYLEGKDLSLRVIIDRNESWFNVFRIPAYEESRNSHSKGKKDWLDKERQQGRSSGLD